MALYLVQHGISAPKGVNHEKGLTQQGREETERIAHVAKNYQINVSKIAHSGKNRAAQTARIFHTALAANAPIEIISGINPLDDVRRFAKSIKPDENALIVGHLPFMQRLVSYLTTGSEETKVYQFQNSGIVCLDSSQGPGGTVDWFIKWTLNPHIS
ncbi:MAG: phosphohistidine phosphatase SixA [Deltaproteobacteria bacterium]|nr:phosphohistidine phosphatase SixA [Deltaproteobacteria bacterium]